MSKKENPVVIFNKMRDDFLSYYDTQFFVNNKKILEERRALVDKEGVMWQSPQLEILKNYKKVAIIFGPESSGLSNEDLRLSDLILSIKTNNISNSLNLSHAVAIISHYIFELSAYSSLLQARYNYFLFRVH